MTYLHEKMSVTKCLQERMNEFPLERNEMEMMEGCDFGMFTRINTTWTSLQPTTLEILWDKLWLLFFKTNPKSFKLQCIGREGRMTE